jgi:hypothetical protein
MPDHGIASAIPPRTEVCMSKPIEINTTTFADFCAATGPARVTVVREQKQKREAGYKQGPDYWKPFRDGFKSHLSRGATPTELKTILNSEHVRPEWESNYELAIDGAIKWLGRKDIVRRPCTTSTWSSGDLVVTVKPEFAAVINDELHIVKLWLHSGNALTKARADVVLHLLDTTHGRGVKSGATVGVLDVFKAKLFTPTRAIKGIDALLQGEAAAFVQIWRAL